MVLDEGSGPKRKATARCDCGAIRLVRVGHLVGGLTKSCGCLMREKAAAARLKHGDARRGRRTTEYAIWKSAVARCHNPNNHAFADYGGRGIFVCEKWRNDFAAFLADVGRRPSPAHSIDRIDNGRGYEPDNVRWATALEQAANRRPYGSAKKNRHTA